MCINYPDTKDLPSGIPPRTTETKPMNKKHVIIAALVGVLAGYALRNRLAAVPVVSKIPAL